MYWFLGIIFALLGLLMMIPNAILGGIVLFVLCVWGIVAGPWPVMLICIFLLFGIAINIFGD